MTIKDGVTQQGAKPVIYYAIGVSEMVFRKEGQRMVVTSLTDSHEDRPKSLHNVGLAVDLRTRDIPTGVVHAIFRQLQSVLDPLGFDVVFEGNHFHIEFDPKNGENWQRFEQPPRPKQDDYVA